MPKSTCTISSVAAVGLGAFAALYLRRAYERRTKQNKFKIPNELLSGKYAEEMKLAVELAIEAGENMVPYLECKGTSSGKGSESALGISTKQNDADFCTTIDIANEDLVTKAIKSKFQDHEVIGEECTGTGEVPALGKKQTWIIDPIDGTTNFASGCPLTCVSIGLCDNGEPVMGVVYAPATMQLYLAMKGKGSYRNGEKLNSTDSNIVKELSNSVVCFEFGYARSEEGIDNMVDAVKGILKHGCRTTRSYGSGVLDICYVAQGSIDVVYTGISEEGWKPWDYCAAMVVAEEAGCTIRSLKNEKGEFDSEHRVVPNTKFDIYSKSMICGVNAKVVEDCRKIVLKL